MNGDLYYSPEKCGLAIVGELEWSEGCYEFDLTCVWRDVASGQMFFAEDAGCSCPSPYESTSVDDLVPIARWQVLADYLDRRIAGLRYCSDEYIEGVKGDAGALVQKVRECMRETSTQQVAE